MQLRYSWLWWRQLGHLTRMDWMPADGSASLSNTDIHSSYTTLCSQVRGDPEGHHTVFWVHGSPSCRLEARCAICTRTVT